MPDILGSAASGVIGAREVIVDESERRVAKLTAGKLDEAVDGLQHDEACSTCFLAALNMVTLEEGLTVQGSRFRKSSDSGNVCLEF